MNPDDDLLDELEGKAIARAAEAADEDLPEVWD